MAIAEAEVERLPTDTVGRVCGSCMFWKPYPSGAAYGECLRIGAGLELTPMAAIVTRDTSPSLITRAMFGCTLWEEHR